MRIIKFDDLKFISPDKLFSQYRVSIILNELSHSRLEENLQWIVVYHHKTTESRQRGMDYDYETTYTYYRYILYKDGFEHGKRYESQALTFKSYADAISFLRNKEFTVKRYSREEIYKEISIDY